MHRGEMDIARQYAERALALCADDDDPRRALPTEALGGICLLTGDLDGAIDYCAAFARLWRLANYEQGEVWSLGTQIVIAGKRGDLERMRTLVDEASAIAEPTCNPTTMALVSYAYGEALLENDPVQALEPLAKALEFARAAGNLFMTGNALVSNTSLRGRHGDPSLALPLFAELIEHWQRSGGWTQLWLTLRNLVDLVSRLGAYEDAAVLYGACETFSRTARPYGAEAERLASVVSTLVTNLSQTGFDEARKRGEGLDEAVAVAFASAVTRRLQHT